MAEPNENGLFSIIAFTISAAFGIRVSVTKLAPKNTYPKPACDAPTFTSGGQPVEPNAFSTGKPENTCPKKSPRDVGRKLLTTALKDETKNTNDKIKSVPTTGNTSKLAIYERNHDWNPIVGTSIPRVICSGATSVRRKTSAIVLNSSHKILKNIIMKMIKTTIVANTVNMIYIDKSGPVTAKATKPPVPAPMVKTANITKKNKNKYATI
jgi:hypothetical protein